MAKRYIVYNNTLLIRPNEKVVAYDGYDKTVMIGDKTYDVIKQGDLLWTKQNLDLDVGESRYPLDDQATYGWEGFQYGQLYTYEEALEAAAMAPEGWRLPTWEEFYYLCVAADGDFQPYYIGADAKIHETAGRKLRTAATSTTSTPGKWYDPASQYEVSTDELGFSVPPAGLYSFQYAEQYHGFDGQGQYAYYWCEFSKVNQTCVRFNRNNTVWMLRNSNINTWKKYSIRLVKSI